MKRILVLVLFATLAAFAAGNSFASSSIGIGNGMGFNADMAPVASDCADLFKKTDCADLFKKTADCADLFKKTDCADLFKKTEDCADLFKKTDCADLFK